MPYDITYKWKLNYDTNQVLYETETESQAQRPDLWLSREGGADGDLGLADAIIHRMDKTTKSYSIAQGTQFNILG